MNKTTPNYIKITDSKELAEYAPINKRTGKPRTTGHFLHDKVTGAKYPITY